MEKTPFRSFRNVLSTAAVGAFALSLATACAAADTATAPRQITVKLGDLNIAKTQGAAALYSRIERAAREVCRPLEERNFTSKLHDACVYNAIAGAVAEVHQPALSNVYKAHNPQPTPIVLAATQSR